ncbi:MAG TPA: tryptophan synthase subunit alpha, partial [Myxococcota bacterium]|nr:tryptophan synthase subunit alpha [Myxococcota bacterium]
MNRIDRAFAKAKAEKRAALIVFVTAGDPDLATTAELVPELAAAGADLVELGIPHSDPIGEGPTIQAASLRSLTQHTTLAQILELVRRVRAVCDVPVVLMGYLNNVLAHGEERTAKDAAAAGADGLIVADTPFEETEMLSRACAESGVHRVLLVAPTSTPARVVRIAAASRGFVYCVSVTGVTGSRQALPPDLAALVGRIRRVTPTPACVGFGVSDAALARIGAQLSIDEKRALADVVIDNSGAWEATEKQVRELFASWTRR